MTWKGEHPDITPIDGHYANGIVVPKSEMKTYTVRFERSTTLPKYDTTIEPPSTTPRVKKDLPIALTIVTIALCEVISGADDFVSIAKFGR